MRSSVVSRATVQGIGLALAATLGTWVCVSVARQPLDAATLLLSVSELHSQASEAQELLARNSRHDVAERFARAHFAQLRKNVASVGDSLASASARPAVRADRRSAARYAAELETILTPWAYTGAMADAPDSAEMRLDGLKTRIVELENTLRDRAQ